MENGNLNTIGPSDKEGSDRARPEEGSNGEPV
jgi:hypothetical protein